MEVNLRPGVGRFGRIVRIGGPARPCGTEVFNLKAVKLLS